MYSCTREQHAHVAARYRTHTHAHRHNTHAARIDSKSCGASCAGPFSDADGKRTARGLFTVCVNIPYSRMWVCTATHFAFEERERERGREGEREEVQPAASKFGWNVTTSRMNRSETMRNKKTVLTSGHTSPLSPELWMPRLGRNVHHDTAGSSSLRLGPRTGWAERTRNWSARICPSPSNSQAGRQAAGSRQAAESSGGRGATRQAGRARKLKAVV